MLKLFFGALFLALLAGVALAIGGAVYNHALFLPLEDARPWTLFQVSEGLVNAYPAAYERAWTATGGVCAAGLIGLVALLVAPDPKMVHGDARFAQPGEIRAAGLRAKTGVLVGKTGSDPNAPLLRHDHETHTLLVAPTGAGKGVGVVIPNLLTYGGSAIVVDVKGENFDKTAGARKAMGDAVFRFSPHAPDGGSHRWNPLAYVSADKTERLSDLRKLALYLFSAPSRDDEIWTQGARHIFVAAALYVLDHRPVKTLGEINRVLSKTPHAEHLSDLAATPGLDPIAARLLEKYAGFTEKQLSGYMGALEPLSLWDDPKIDAATAENDFDLRQLRHRSMTIYLSIAPDEIEELGVLVRLFFQQVVGLLHRSEPDADQPYPVLLLLDEFRTLGRMETILSAVTTLRSYGGRFLFVVQGLSNLDELYGAEGRSTILGNCGVQVFFGVNDPKSVQHVVERLGRTTIKKISRSIGGGRTPVRNTAEDGRELLSLDEVVRLNPNHALIFRDGARPVGAHKIRYFAEKRFNQRITPAQKIPRLDMDPLSILAEIADMERAAGDDVSVMASQTSGRQPADAATEQATSDDLACAVSPGMLTGDERYQSAVLKK